MRLVFIGTGDIGVPTLQCLLKSQYGLVGVVTQPDKPVGRAQLVEPPPIKKALMNGAPGSRALPFPAGRACRRAPVVAGGVRAHLAWRFGGHAATVSDRQRQGADGRSLYVRQTWRTYKKRGGPTISAGRRPGGTPALRPRREFMPGLT